MLENMMLDNNGNIIILNNAEVEKRIQKAKDKTFEMRGNMFNLMFTKTNDFYSKKVIKQLLKDLNFLDSQSGDLYEVNKIYDHQRKNTIDVLKKLSLKLSNQLLLNAQEELFETDTDIMDHNQKLSDIRDLLILNDYEVLLNYDIKVVGSF